MYDASIEGLEGVSNWYGRLYTPDTVPASAYLLTTPMIHWCWLLSEKRTFPCVSKKGGILLANPQVPKFGCPRCLLWRQKSWGNFPKKKYS